MNFNWISKHPEKLPDFMIGGAMKSGTTTLHAILDQHPAINIAHEELGFFDIDNIITHPDFHFFNGENKEWIIQSMEKYPQELWNWYYAQFEHLIKEGGLIGEDSTTYLASPLVAQRLALQKKPIKLIFMLRDPTKRTISNYTHALKSGRAIYNLENTLRYDPNSILRRSLYKEQLEEFYKHIPFERIKIIVFEDFIKNIKSSVAEICEFLEIDFNEFKEENFTLYANKTKMPKNEKLQLMRNRMLRYYGNHRYSTHLPLKPKEIRSNISLSHKMIDKIHKRINPKKDNIKYQPNPSTIAYLNTFFKTKMEGLDELVKKDITSEWFH